MKIIGFAGQLMSGKDVCSDYLYEKLMKRNNTGKWERLAFATAVKKVFCDSFGVDLNFIEEWKRKSENPPNMLQPVRQSLQFIGDGFRKIKKTVWTEMALSNKSKQYIISDSRYIDEANIIHEKDGINIVLYRTGFLNDDPNLSEAQIRPIVEWCIKTQKDGCINNKSSGPEGIENYDLFLENNGTLEDLYNKIDNIIIPFIENKYSEKMEIDRKNQYLDGLMY